MKRNSFMDTLTFQGIESMGRYYSFYRGIVIDNYDPDRVNCIEVAVPYVQGNIPSIWATPFGQWGGANGGFKMLAPEIGDIVWVFFEQGDPNHPLWTYCGWDPDEVPNELSQPYQMGILTPNGNVILLDDLSGDLQIGIHGTLDVHIEGNSEVHVDGDVNLNVDGTINYNQGINEGMVKIKELTDKLNQLVTELNNLRTLFNTHTHFGVKSGPDTSATPVQISTSPFSPFNKSDYENTKIKH